MPISTVRSAQRRAPAGPARFPAAKVWIWNLFVGASPTTLAIISAPPCAAYRAISASSCHAPLDLGIDCAIAGAAIVAAPAAANPVTLMKSLRFMAFLPRVVRSAFLARLEIIWREAWNIRFPNAIRKNPPLAGAGLSLLLRD